MSGVKYTSSGPRSNSTSMEPIMLLGFESHLVSLTTKSMRTYASLICNTWTLIIMTPIWMCCISSLLSLWLDSSLI